MQIAHSGTSSGSEVGSALKCPVAVWKFSFDIAATSSTDSCATVATAGTLGLLSTARGAGVSRTIGSGAGTAMLLRCQLREEPRAELRVVAAEAAAERAAAAAAAMDAMARGRSAGALATGGGAGAELKCSISSSTANALTGDAPTPSEDGEDGEDGRGGAGEGDGRTAAAMPTELERDMPFLVPLPIDEPLVAMCLLDC